MRRCLVLALAAMAVLGLPACGSSESNPSTSASAAAPAANTRNVDAIDRARIQAAVCMRAHGIEIPDFTTGRTQTLKVLQIVARYPAATVRSAAQACAASIRRAFPNAATLSPEQRAQRRQEALVFAECMRSHGIRYPDPTTATSNLSGYLSALSALDMNSPAYKAAAPGCRTQALKAAG
jgi:hypothetical protein